MGTLFIALKKKRLEASHFVFHVFETILWCNGAPDIVYMRIQNNSAKCVPTIVEMCLFARRLFRVVERSFSNVYIDNRGRSSNQGLATLCSLHGK